MEVILTIEITIRVISYKFKNMNMGKRTPGEEEKAAIKAAEEAAALKAQQEQAALAAAEEYVPEDLGSVSDEDESESNLDPLPASKETVTPNNEAENNDKEYFSAITRDLQFNAKGFAKLGKRPIEVMTTSQARKVVDKLGQRNDLKITQTMQAIAMLASAGGSNKRVPNTLKVEVLNPDTGLLVEINKAELLNTLKQVAGHTNIKMFVRALSTHLIKLGEVAQEQLGITIPGDLAATINKRLRSKGQPKLSWREEICAASYLTHLENLNQLAKSDRLVMLLQEDEAIRFSEVPRNKQKPSQKSKKSYSDNRKEANKKANQKQQQNAFKQQNQNSPNYKAENKGNNSKK